MQKYGFDDARDVLERASARETAARVAAGTLAKALLSHLGVSIVLSHVIQLGRRPSDAGPRRPRARWTPRRCAASIRCEAEMIAASRRRPRRGDSLGGVVEVLAYGVPPGLGSHVHWDRKVDGLVAQALMSIQAMKGVEIGEGFDKAGRRGSEAHDEILWESSGTYERGPGRAGGIEGGMTGGSLSSPGWP